MEGRDQAILALLILMAACSLANVQQINCNTATSGAYPTRHTVSGEDWCCSSNPVKCVNGNPTYNVTSPPDRSIPFSIITWTRWNLLQDTKVYVQGNFEFFDITASPTPAPAYLTVNTSALPVSVGGDLVLNRVAALPRLEILAQVGENVTGLQVFNLTGAIVGTFNLITVRFYNGYVLNSSVPAQNLTLCVDGTVTNGACPYQECGNRSGIRTRLFPLDRMIFGELYCCQNLLTPQRCIKDYARIVEVVVDLPSDLTLVIGGYFEVEELTYLQSHNTNVTFEGDVDVTESRILNANGEIVFEINEYACPVVIKGDLILDSQYSVLRISTFDILSSVENTTVFEIFGSTIGQWKRIEQFNEKVPPQNLCDPRAGPCSPAGSESGNVYGGGFRICPDGTIMYSPCPVIPTPTPRPTSTPVPILSPANLPSPAAMPSPMLSPVSSNAPSLEIPTMDSNPSASTTSDAAPVMSPLSSFAAPTIYSIPSNPPVSGEALVSEPSPITKSPAPQEISSSATSQPLSSPASTITSIPFNTPMSIQPSVINTIVPETLVPSLTPSQAEPSIANVVPSETSTSISLSPSNSPTNQPPWVAPGPSVLNGASPAKAPPVSTPSNLPLVPAKAPNAFPVPNEIGSSSHSNVPVALLVITFLLYVCL